MRILFTGGGTMGPVTPLLAVWEAWKTIEPSVEGLWVGTQRGPEREVVRTAGIPFFSLPVARCPRYPSFEWLTAPFMFVWAWLKAISILCTQRINLVASAGGYTAVPIVYAARLCGIKVWVHQQDVELTKTTRLTAPFADFVTVAWQRNKDELGARANLVGNPVRPSLLLGSHARASKAFHLHPEKSTVLVVGGGTGSIWINTAIREIASELGACANIIHLTGRGKMIEPRHQNHHVIEFLEQGMADALMTADVVVSRAGMGSITELAALSKAAVVIPLPNTPQESNARVIADACVVLEEKDTTPGDLLESIESLLLDEPRRRDLGDRLHAKIKTDVVAQIVYTLRALQ